MALKKCKECGQQVSLKADTCPNCGVKNPAASWFNYTGTGCSGTGCLSIIGGLVVLFVILGVIGSLGDLDTSSYETAEPSSADSYEPNVTDRQRRYAHRTINVRVGRGTQHEIVEQFNRGDMLYVDSLSNGWWKVYTGPSGGPLGYVSASVVEDSPLPSFEIQTWNWRTDPSFGTDGAVIWTAVIRNNSGQYVDNVRVEFTTFDAQGNVLDTEYSYAQDLPPGGTSSVQGYADYFGREDKGQIQIKP